MPVVKGGVWTNIEDEILKASVSKYGLNQWARVSSLLARKTAKQCKARWTEWLDPAIRKVEWSKEEDEKLLHLAKLMPTQWRTIAPIVGRTATQCLERYQRLLDEAEARENDELALGGPAGGETAAPTADDVRKLRPGELDPDPESKPARPDTIDLDEDEKEMLSEARARLANTQGKKAKRKARERQLEESRRLAVLQKRRELKNAGINIKINTRKQGEMDYNADIPFEKAPVAGFYDTMEEQEHNEKEREAFDPRKQQLARKRQGDADDKDDSKRQKQDKAMREAEQQSRRRALNLPAPQVSDAELEDIVKIGMAGDKAVKASGDGGAVDDQGLVSRYTNMVGATPIRTPRAPAQEDHIANSIRDIKALTEVQSSLLGGENTPLHEGAASTGFDSVAPRRNQITTPNPMATPFRQTGGVSGVGATPLRTPRDNYTLNAHNQLVSQTPVEARRAENIHRQMLRAKLASLPKPKATEWELEELPSETAESGASAGPGQAEDQEEIDARARAQREAEAAAEFKRQSTVYQRALPRPKTVDYASLTGRVAEIADPVEAAIAAEMALLLVNDAKKFPLPGSKIIGKPGPLPSLEDEWIAKARAELDSECNEEGRTAFQYSLDTHWKHTEAASDLPLANPDSTPVEEYRRLFTSANEQLLATAQAGNKLEKELSKLQGGYLARSKGLRKKIDERFSEIEAQRDKLSSFQVLQTSEQAALSARLERLRADAERVMRKEREMQDDFRAAKDELNLLLE
ncbi:hypothetical protein DV737_g1044, partial [Chaetothyriales sp. CBS 132003]